jgi:hypothetical protein
VTDRVASIRATLKTNAFVAGLNEITTKSAAAGRKIGSALSTPIKEGLTKAKAGWASTVGDLKNVAKLAAGIGGGLSLASMVSDAIELEGTYRSIAFNVNKVPGNMSTWQQIQKDVESAAMRTGASSKDLASAYNQIFKEVGDQATAKSAIEVIGTAATAGQGKVEELVGVIPLLSEKFHIAAKDIPEAMTRIIEKLGTGGTNVEDIGTKFELMAADAVEAGLTGADGISKLLDVTAMLDNRLGAKAAPALKQMLEKLRDGGAAMKEFKKSTGISLKGVEGFDKLKSMLGGKGRAKAELMFTGDVRSAFDELVKPFDEAVAKAKAAGKSAKEAEKEGKAAFEASLAAVGKSSMKFADLQKEAADKLANDPATILHHALEEASQAFRDPQMLSAIRSLAKDLPPLAHGFAKLVGWVVAHPWLAGGAALAARPAMGLAGGFVQSGAEKLAGKASGAIGESIAAAAAKSGAWAGVVGPAIAVAAAAVIAFELGKAGIDKAIGDQFKKVNTLQDATNVGGVAEQGSKAQKLEAIRILRGKIAESKKGPGFAAEGIGVVSDIFESVGSVGKGGKKNLTASNIQADAIAKAEAQVAALEASLSKTSEQTADAGHATSRFTVEVEGAARALRKIAAAAGTDPSGGKGAGGAGGAPRPGAAPVAG